MFEEETIKTKTINENKTKTKTKRKQKQKLPPLVVYSKYGTL